jgi:tripartite-type tricarboxylate transporter receptor subunit TctC
VLAAQAAAIAATAPGAGFLDPHDAALKVLVQGMLDFKLLNGTLDAMVYHPLGFLPQIEAGAIRPIAVTGAARHPLFPAVPTLGELGVPDAVVEGWWALYAPAGTPAPIIARLNAIVNATLADPATRAELVRQGLVVRGGTPEQLAAETAREVAGQKALAKAANITAE